MGGRLAAAIDVLGEIEQRHRPASEALADWGRSHRFAGSADRSAIGNLVFDALRCKRSLAWRMDADTPRVLVLGAFAWLWGNDDEQIDAVLSADRHAPEPLSDAERSAVRGGGAGDMRDDVAADIPAWLWPEFAAVFGERAVEEGRALAQRAPLDLRVNTLKADRAKVLRALSRFGAVPTPHAPHGVRIQPPAGAGRLPNVQAEAAFQKGWFEVQDEGSQLSALATGAAPGMQVADICAGAGGKTLALAAMMENKGQLHAYDADKHRLKGIFERLKRAGTRNVQVLQAGDEAELAPLAQRMDVVLVDAPCTGSGVWRRRPDAKWRLSAQALETRLKEQAEILRQAAELVRPGGRLVYVTCSVLAAENERQVEAFLRENTAFALAPSAPLGESLGRTGNPVRLSPAGEGCDGFFIAGLERTA